MGRGHFPGPAVGFSALDVDRNGVLDADEIEASGSRLAKLDANGDGRITAEEIRLAIPQRGRNEERRGGGGAGNGEVEETVKSLMALDANGDGKLSKEELPERFQGILTRGDEDKDGFLTPAEIRNVAAAQTTTSGHEESRREGFGRALDFIRMDPLLAAVDINGDGILSPEEIRNSAVSLRKLDKNSDGKISREEASPMRRPQDHHEAPRL